MHRCSAFEVLWSTPYTADRIYEVGLCSIAYMVENDSYVFAPKLLRIRIFKTSAARSKSLITKCK